MSHTNWLMAGVLALLLQPAAAGGDGYKLLILDGSNVKWPVHNGAVTVTFATAYHHASVQGTENCRKTAGLDGLLSRSTVRRDEFRESLKRAFQLWSAAANVHFVQATPNTQADLTITAEGEPDGIAFTDVTHASGQIDRGIICLNPQVHWTADNADVEGTYRLTYVLAHEIGHAIGLDHPSPEGALMSFQYSRTRQGLTQGDIAGAVFLYGAAPRRTADASHR